MSAGLHAVNDWKLVDRPRTSARDCVERGMRLHGPGNLIASVMEYCRRPDMIDLILYGVVTRSHWGGHRFFGTPTTGGGAALQWEIACAAAIGEAIERSCGQWFDPSEVQQASINDLGDRALDPRSFSLFSPRQYETTDFPYRPFDADEAMSWTPGYSLTQGRPILVPAEMVYLNHHLEAGHLKCTSNGMACAISLEEALLSGLYELIERDAFMIAWLGRRSMPCVDPEKFDNPELTEVVRRIRRARAELHLIDITTDVGVPSYLGVVLAMDGQHPSMALGAASQFSPSLAALKAATEAAHSWNWACTMLANREPVPKMDMADVELGEFSDHVWLYVQPWTRPHAEFLFAGVSETEPRSETASFDTPRQELEALVARLKDMGLEVCATDLSPPELLPAGFRVVRTMVPGLVPLSLAEPTVFKQSPRLYAVPREAGDPTPPRCEEDLNRDPHPFP